jgi:hypothetical protein
MAKPIRRGMNLRWHLVYLLVKLNGETVHLHFWRPELAILRFRQIKFLQKFTSIQNAGSYRPFVSRRHKQRFS